MDARIAVEATDSAASRGEFVSIEPYSRRSADAAGNEFLLFFKPELTHPLDRLQGVWPLVQGVLERFDCHLVAAAACGWRYLQRHGIFEQHYGVINQISSRGLAAVTETGRNNI